MGSTFGKKAAKALADITQRETKNPASHQTCVNMVHAHYHIKQQGDTPEVYAARVFDSGRIQLEERDKGMAVPAPRASGTFGATLGERTGKR